MIFNVNIVMITIVEINAIIFFEYDIIGHI